MFISEIISKKRCFIISLVVAIWSCIFTLASADWNLDSFVWLVNKSIDDGMLSSSGNFDTWPNTVVNWANMGNGVFSFPKATKSNRFAIAFTVTMDSASRTPNTWESGCGLTWSYRDNDYGCTELVAKAMMDGNIYIQGWENCSYLSYGKYYYGSPSTRKTLDLAFVVNGDKMNVYLGQQRIVRKVDLPILGSSIGFITSSGTNLDYGVRCNYTNIFIYTE